VTSVVFGSPSGGEAESPDEAGGIHVFKLRGKGDSEARVGGGGHRDKKKWTSDT